MSKNKFIKVLKIFAVFFPLIFGFVGRPLVLFAYSNGYSINEFIPDGVADTYFPTLESRATTELESLAEAIFSGYFSCIALNGYTDMPIAYQLCEFTTTTFFGVTIQELLNFFSADPLGILPIGCIAIFIWYIFIELIFFIPEILLMFIRWCKNLIYAFTQKGGFDT